MGRILLVAVDEYGPAMGTRFVSAALKAAGFATTVVFARGQVTKRVAMGESLAFTPQVHRKIAELAENSLYVGISVATPTFHKAREITEQLKRSLDIPVVWGGCHSTTRPEECLEYADIVCLGEGERLAVDLAYRLESEISYDDIPGLMTSGCCSYQTPAPAAEASQIPIPDYALDGSHWLANRDEIISIDTGTPGAAVEGYDYYIAPTRGCPFKCSFCINNLYAKMYKHAKRFRCRSIESVMEELSWAKDNIQGIRRVLIDDDCFMAMSEGDIYAFSREYKKHVNMPFVIRGVHPNGVTEAKLKALCDAGLVQVRIGMQTGSDRIRQLYEREWENNEKILECARLINRFIKKGLLHYVMYDLIVDNPWETEDDKIRTLDLVMSLPRPFMLYIFSLTFYPGTALYNRAVDQGLVRGDTLDDAYWHQYWNVTPTRINQTYELFRYYSLGTRLGYFLAQPPRNKFLQILSDLIRGTLSVLRRVIPELSLFTRSGKRFDMDFRVLYAPDTVSGKFRKIDERQKKRAGVLRPVIWFLIWFRSVLRVFYRIFLAPRCRQPSA